MRRKSTPFRESALDYIAEVLLCVLQLPRRLVRTIRVGALRRAQQRKPSRGWASASAHWRQLKYVVLVLGRWRSRGEYDFWKRRLAERWRSIAKTRQH